MTSAAKPFDREEYWAERYRVIDLTKSGHIDLPVAYNKWLYRRKVECLMRDLRRAGFHPKGASVLEIATGTGVYVEAWKGAGVARLVGIDISQAATDALRVRFPAYSFHKRDLGEPGLAKLTGTGFDLVTAVDMVYHIVEDERFPVALANMAEAVKPGGLLAIHDVFPHREELDFGYLKLRTLETFVRALDKAGFDIVSRTPTFFFAVQTHDHLSEQAQKRMDAIWDRFTARLIQRAPGAAGAFTYAIDRALGMVLREGPSFEMLVCRRRG
ncbi:MAG: class I SAM-dependent methyltransferase [Fibrobacteres bacterium]|nr:class I SAM-dependent methyltransferase [Fibrobacterota bacterium]